MPNLNSFSGEVRNERALPRPGNAHDQDCDRLANLLVSEVPTADIEL